MQVATSEELEALHRQFIELRAEVALLKSSQQLLKWVSVDEACELMDIKTRGTIKRMCDDGRLEYTKGVRKVRISYASIVKYNNKHIVK